VIGIDELEQLMNWTDRIHVDPAILVGKPVIRGTRLAVEFIVGLLAQGWTTEDVLKEYDHITRQDIQACLAYAHELLFEERIFPFLPEAPADHANRSGERRRAGISGAERPR
jgi:uncharacterized protein (DUF433 family)